MFCSTEAETSLQVWSEHIDPELLPRSELISPISDHKSFLTTSKTPERNSRGSVEG